MLCWYLGICGGLFVDLFIIVPSKLNFLTYIVLVLLCVTNCFQFVFCFVHIFPVFTVFEICLFILRSQTGKDYKFTDQKQILKILVTVFAFCHCVLYKAKIVCFCLLFKNVSTESFADSCVLSSWYPLILKGCMILKGFMDQIIYFYGPVACMYVMYIQ